MNFKQVGNIGLELSLRTFRDDLLLAPFVDNTGAPLTLVTLLTNTPNKIATVKTESWLLKVDSHELVTIKFLRVSDAEFFCFTFSLFLSRCLLLC